MLASFIKYKILIPINQLNNLLNIYYEDVIPI